MLQLAYLECDLVGSLELVLSPYGFSRVDRRVGPVSALLVLRGACNYILTWFFKQGVTDEGSGAELTVRTIEWILRCCCVAQRIDHFDIAKRLLVVTRILRDSVMGRRALQFRISALADDLFSLRALHMTANLKCVVVIFASLIELGLLIQKALVVRGRLSDSLAERGTTLSIMVVISSTDWDGILERLVFILGLPSKLGHYDARPLALLRRCIV